MNEWYVRLSERERRMVALGAAAVVAILLIGVFLPLHRNVTRTAERVERKRADLKWIEDTAPELAGAGGAARPVAPTSQESLVVVIDRSARESGLASALTGTQPSGNGALQVRLEKAPFDAMVAWLARLADQNAIRVESATIDAAGPGLVNAGLVLRAR